MSAADEFMISALFPQKHTDLYNQDAHRREDMPTISWEANCGRIWVSVYSNKLNITMIQVSNCEPPLWFELHYFACRADYEYLHHQLLWVNWWMIPS